MVDMNSSSTPRTDAAQFGIHLSHRGEHAVPVEFARQLERECRAKDERIAGLTEALRPFARWASGFGPYGREDSWVIAKTPSGKVLTMGDVRQAFAALAETQEGQGDANV